MNEVIKKHSSCLNIEYVDEEIKELVIVKGLRGHQFEICFKSTSINHFIVLVFFHDEFL